MSRLIGMKETYQQQGYIVVRNFLNDEEVSELHKVLCEFHRLWQKDNASHYAKSAVNSAYLTNDTYLNTEQRSQLFNFIGSAKVMELVKALIPQKPCFLNTQLFFNPVNKEQNNYWHRDPQYHLSLAQQKAILSSFDVIHFRLPLMNEPGIELVPGTHKRWDTNDELNVRLAQNNRESSEPLSQGKVIKLSAGDLLIFSANMIHRGLYGMERLAFDLLFCSPEPSVLAFVADNCLPDKSTVESLDDSSAFINTMALKAKLKSSSVG